jgi:hypothetical protein
MWKRESIALLPVSPLHGWPRLERSATLLDCIERESGTIQQLRPVVAGVTNRFADVIDEKYRGENGPHDKETPGAPREPIKTLLLCCDPDCKRTSDPPEDEQKCQIHKTSKVMRVGVALGYQ